MEQADEILLAENEGEEKNWARVVTIEDLFFFLLKFTVAAAGAAIVFGIPVLVLFWIAGGGLQPR